MHVYCTFMYLAICITDITHNYSYNVNKIAMHQACVSLYVNNKA